jgi:hypothetical protein
MIRSAEEGFECESMSVGGGVGSDGGVREGECRRGKVRMEWDTRVEGREGRDCCRFPPYESVLGII